MHHAINFQSSIFGRQFLGRVAGHGRRTRWMSFG
jgi:hypothetical protein